MSPGSSGRWQRLVNANVNENADLHRALKGGGSNFGIVTRFDLDTHPLVSVQCAINLYNPADCVEINKATVAVQEAMENDPKIGLFTNYNNGFVAVGLLYGDTPAERPAAFDPFLNLTSLISTALPTTNGTLLSLAEAMGHAQDFQKRTICTATAKVLQELYNEVYKAWAEVVKSFPAGIVLHYTIQPLGESGVEAGKDRGDNIMELESIPQCWWVFTCSEHYGRDCPVSGQGERTAVGPFVYELRHRFPEAPARSYGADNLKTIQDTAAEYDPERVFQKFQYRGFLLRDKFEGSLPIR